MYMKDFPLYNSYPPAVLSFRNLHMILDIAIYQQLTKNISISSWKQH